MRIGLYAVVALLALGAGMLLSGQWSEPTGPDSGSLPEQSPTDITFLDLDGATKTLNDWRGTTLLVNFWATWCGPCRVEIPLLQSVRERYRARNFEVLGIAIDQESAVREFRDQLAIDYPLLLVGADDTDLLAKFGNPHGALPHSVILSPAGVILAAHTGPLIEEQIQSWLVPHL